MSVRSGPRRLISPLLLAAMLAIVVAAAFTPNTGVVSATSNCQYGSCSQGQELTVPLDYVLIGIIVVETGLLAVALAMLFQRRGGPSSPPMETPSQPSEPAKPSP